MMKMSLQLFAEAAAEAVADGEAAMPQAEEQTTADEVPQEPQTQPQGQEAASEAPDAQSLQQLHRIAEGRMRMQDWQAQEAQVREFYPSFSFSQLYNGNEDFARLLRAGVSVRQAYEVTHLPQILTAAMQYAARKAAEKTANAMYCTADRPQENGLCDRRAGLPSEKRVDKLTQTDIIRILDRVGKGDKITF